jgi:hypothetical protein
MPATGGGKQVSGYNYGLSSDVIGAVRRSAGRSPVWIKVKNPDAPAATRIMEWP